MEDLKRDLFNIRRILDTMDWLLEEKQNRPFSVKNYMEELKESVSQLDEHSKCYYKQYDILELHKMERDELDEIADHYNIDRLSTPKQVVIYEILDRQIK